MRLYSEKVLNGFTCVLLFLLAKWIFQFLWISTGNTWKVKTIFQSGNKPRFVLITTNINSISHCYHELISCQFKIKDMGHKMIWIIRLSVTKSILRLIIIYIKFWWNKIPNTFWYEKKFGHNLKLFRFILQYTILVTLKKRCFSELLSWCDFLFEVYLLLLEPVHFILFFCESVMLNLKLNVIKGLKFSNKNHDKFYL